MRGSDNHIGECGSCGKLRYESRKAAKAVGKRLGSDGRTRPYRCPANPEYWHNGHLPAAVLRGDIDRAEYRLHLKPVRQRADLVIVDHMYRGDHKASDECMWLGTCHQPRAAHATSRNQRRTLTPEQRADLLADYQREGHAVTIADRYGVTAGYVRWLATQHRDEAAS